MPALSPELVEAQNRILYWYLKRKGADRETAKELVNEVWLKAKYDPEKGAPGTFLLRAADWVMANHWEQVSRRRREVSMVRVEHGPDGEEEYEIEAVDPALSAEEKFLLKEIIERCTSTELEKAVARLWIEDEYGIRKVAEATGASFQQVRTIMAKLGSRMRRLRPRKSRER